MTQTPFVLPDAALAGAKLMADQQIGSLQPANTNPLIVGAGALLFVAFGPLLGMRLFDRRGRHRLKKVSS